LAGLGCPRDCLRESSTLHGGGPFLHRWVILHARLALDQLGKGDAQIVSGNPAENGRMKITELPTTDLLRLLRATEAARAPDPDALEVLQRELMRRLDVADRSPGQASHKQEVLP
jgi:hypothetical protein